MIPTLRRLVATLLLAAATGPAVAGGITIDRAPLANTLAPAENCGYDRARTVLQNDGMTVLADVPRTATAYRFIVHWKGEDWGASVQTDSCKIEPVPKPALRHPWCEYMPGIRLQCPMAMSP
jgi:hypothetical protein